MAIPRVVLFHYGSYQPLWDQPGLLQCGPQIGPDGISVSVPHVVELQKALEARGVSHRCALLHYTDPFLIRKAGLQGLEYWLGPKLLVCGDLHHGPMPLETLMGYQKKEFHDAVLLAFNPMLLEQVRACLSIPVHSMPPGFFRYPVRAMNLSPERRLIHVGSTGAHHPARRKLVQELLERSRIPFFQTTTQTAEEAADLYNQSFLVLNVPLNNDLNHRFFEIMAAGSRQIIFADRHILGPHQDLCNRPDIFWVQTLHELETLVHELLGNLQLPHLPVSPPPEHTLDQLLIHCFKNN